MLETMKHEIRVSSNKIARAPGGKACAHCRGVGARAQGRKGAWSTFGTHISVRKTTQPCDFFENGIDKELTKPVVEMLTKTDTGTHFNIQLSPRPRF
jgi:hypothetical protein